MHKAPKSGGRLTDRGTIPKISTILSLGTRDAQKVLEDYNVDLNYTLEGEARSDAFEELFPTIQGCRTAASL